MDFISALFTEMRNSFAQYTLVPKGPGKGILKSKVRSQTFIDPRDELDREVRMKGYGGTGHVSGVLLKVIELGYREAKRPLRPENLFVRDNAATLCAARVDETGKVVREFDFGAMKVANGSLDPVNVTVTHDEDTRTLTFTQDGEVLIGGRASADDEVHACILESQRELVMLQALRARGESGSTSVALPAGWDGGKIFVYVFATSARERRSSPSTRAYPAPTEAEMLEARLADLEGREQERRREAEARAFTARKERKVKALLAAHEQADIARQDAIDAGKSEHEAEVERARVFDRAMEELHEEEARLEDERVETEERLAAKRRAREEKARARARERRKAIATRLAAEQAEQRELDLLERREKKRRLDDLRAK